MRDVAVQMFDDLSIHCKTGGAIATLLALDVVMNSERIPVRKLHLWTFGAPQIADQVFFDNHENNTRAQRFCTTNSNRYVTYSDRCKPDMVSSIVPGGSHGMLRPRYLLTIRGTSVLAAHSMQHYQMGLSASNQWSTDLPLQTRKACLGEKN